MRMPLALFLLALTVAPVTPAKVSAAEAGPSYEEAVLPLLRGSCVGCHNDAEPESGFSVET